MPDSTLADFSALAGEVAMGTYPILPKPEWGQDAAMVAFFIDGLRAEIIVLLTTDSGYVAAAPVANGRVPSMLMNT